jgi:HEAT repeat protein
LFDLSWEIREEAIKALKDRKRQDYQQVLLDGLRYPWAPVAAHAAEALAALDHRDSVFRLAAMLDEPDPCAPKRDKSN